MQSGIDYFSSKSSGFVSENNGLLSNTVIRYGLTEPFEVSALIEYRFEDQTLSNNENNSLTGWSAIDLGMRYHIFTGHGLVPNVGFQIRWRIPRISGDYEIDQWAPRFIFVTSQRLSEKMTFISNWGASWNGNNGVPQGNYTANLSYAFNDKFGVFIENYGNVFRSDFDTYFDGGLAWLVNNDFQIDLSSGYGSNEGVKEFFVSAGISIRTKKKTN